MIVARSLHSSLCSHKTLKRTPNPFTYLKNLHFGGLRGYHLNFRTCISFLNSSSRQRGPLCSRSVTSFLIFFTKNSFSTLKKKDTSPAASVKRIRARPIPFAAVPKANPKLKLITYLGDLRKKKIILNPYESPFPDFDSRPRFRRRKVFGPVSALQTFDSKPIVLGLPAAAKKRVIFKSDLPYKLRMWQFPMDKYMRVY